MHHLFLTPSITSNGHFDSQHIFLEAIVHENTKYPNSPATIVIFYIDCRIKVNLWLCPCTEFIILAASHEKENHFL